MSDLKEIITLLVLLVLVYIINILQNTEKKERGNFSWFHATSVNGGAMIIAAIISSYFAKYMTDTMMIPLWYDCHYLYNATDGDIANLYGRIYKEMIAAGTLSIMVGHIAMPAYEDCGRDDLKY